MNIIGINDGHNSSVALSMDGKIVFALSEERPSRVKNFWGVPKLSLDIIFRDHCAKEEIDYFGIYRNSGADFWVYLYPFHECAKKHSFRWFFQMLLTTVGPYLFYFLDIITPKSFLIKYYSNLLGVPKDKIILVNHHRSHIESARFSLDSEVPWLIVTVDAEGDLESGTVYKTTNGGSSVEKLASISRKDSLGYFYTWITEYLGMKPNEHEFKVMGLEPYVRKNTKEYARVFGKLSKLFWFDGMNYKAKIPTTSHSFKNYLRRELYKERFDNIAAAAQLTLESVVSKWISNWIETTGIKNVALSGGTMMNVKLAQRIYLLPEIERLYVTPSSGDETTVLGVCNFIQQKFSDNGLEKLQSLYLGCNRTNEEIDNWVRNIDNTKFRVVQYAGLVEAEVANLLAAGHVVARFNGRDEFGARALGNRSILAHPSNPETIAKINKLIKDRDFWMPFTPSILESRANEYIKNPKHIYSPYMSMTFESTEEGAVKFAAAIHPYDKTMRIQMVSQEWNQSYYRLIEEFGSRTGTFGILNTSFNLHGEPNVFSPDDALRTLDNSGLYYLAIGDYIVQKVGAEALSVNAQD
jgi:carbamoyltransferase